MIKLEGEDIRDLRFKLGFHNPDYGITLRGDPYQPTFYVHARDASQHFTSALQALAFLRVELLTHLRRNKLEREKLRKELRKKNKPKTWGGKVRKVRPIRGLTTQTRRRK